MELRWYRGTPSPAVYVYKNGEHMHEEQMEEYRGRTTFMGNHIARGEAAVKIHNITIFDNGTYHCVFKEHTSHSQATLWLNVAGEGLAWGSWTLLGSFSQHHRSCRLWPPEPEGWRRFGDTCLQAKRFSNRLCVLCAPRM